MQVENARGYKGDKTIAKTVVEKDEKGNTVEYQYNSEGVCLVAKVLEWAQQKVKHKRKGYKMHMILWQLAMLLVGAIVGLLGQILHRDKVTQVGSVMVFIGASAFIYSILAVVF